MGWRWRGHTHAIPAVTGAAGALLAAACDGLEGGGLTRYRNKGGGAPACRLAIVLGAFLGVAAADAGGLAGEVPEQELVKPRPGLGNRPGGAALRGVVDEDALVHRDLFILVTAYPKVRIGRVIANAARISNRLASVLADELPIAVGDAVLVAFCRAVEAHGLRLRPPGTPEAHVATVEGAALAKAIEGGLDGLARHAAADADQGPELRRLGERGQVDAAQGRGILVVEASKDYLAVRGAGRGGGTEDLRRVGVRDDRLHIVGDQHHVRHAAGGRQLGAVIEHDGLIFQRTVEHASLADVVHREVALEYDGVAAGHRGRTREHVEHGRGLEAGDCEDREAGHGPELAGAGDERAKRVGVDAGGSRPGLVTLRTVCPHRLVVAARGDGVREHVDARERRCLDEGGEQRVVWWVMRVVRLRNLGLAVEDPDDGAVGHSHVAGVDAVDGLVSLVAATPTTSFTSPAPGADDHQPAHVHRGLVVTVEFFLARGHHIVVVHHRNPGEPGGCRGLCSKGHDCSNSQHGKY